MSTAQVESALVEHAHVAEAAVVSIPHKIKGECLYCFVTPKDGFRVEAETKAELKHIVREKIAPFAMPDYIQVEQRNGGMILNCFKSH
jgi:acetyl-CoA synthetase